MKKSLVWISALLAATLCLASCSGPATGKVSDKNDKSEIEDEDDRDDADDGDYDEDDIIAWKNEKASESIRSLQGLAGEEMFRELTLGSLTEGSMSDYIDSIVGAETTGNVYVVDMSEAQVDYYRSMQNMLSADIDKMSEPAKAISVRGSHSLITNTLSSKLGPEMYAVASMFTSTNYCACDMIFENEAWIHETDTDGVGFCVCFYNDGEGVVAVTCATFFYGEDDIDDCFETTLSNLGMTYELIDTDVDSDYKSSARKLKSYSDDEILEWKTEAAKTAFDDVLTLANDDIYIEVSGADYYLSQIDFDFEDINPYGTVYVIDTSKDAMKDVTLKLMAEDDSADPALLTDSIIDYMYRRSTNFIQSYVSDRDKIEYVLAGTLFTTTTSYAAKMDFVSETWIIDSDTEGFGICVNFTNVGDGIIIVTGMPLFYDDIEEQLADGYFSYEVIEIDFE